MEHFSPKIVKAVETVKTSPSVQRAFDYVKEHLEETIRDQKELVLIEAPTGHEKAKAERYLSMLREAGLDDIYMDEHFNVIGKLHGTGNTGCSVLLEGHLDTVFSFGDVKGIETDAEGRIHCPGICDDTRAIAANLAKGFDLKTSVQRAKDYISGALAAMLDLGKGAGPMNHAFDLQGEFAKEAQ